MKNGLTMHSVAQESTARVDSDGYAYRYKCIPKMVEHKIMQNFSLAFFVCQCEKNCAEEIGMYDNPWRDN